MLRWKMIWLFWGIVALGSSGAMGAEKKANGATATHPPELAKPKPVVLFKVNNKEYTTPDYVGFLQRNQAYAQAAMTSDAGKVEAIRALIGGVLIKEAMEKDESLLPNKDKSTAKEVGEAYEKLAEKHFPAPPTPDEATLYQYYQEHQQEFGIPEMVRVSQIQFRYPANASAKQKEEVKARAEAALKRLESGEDFGKLAEALTENPVAKLPKGDIGYIPRDSGEWLKAAVKGLKPGDRTGVIESDVGYELILVTDVRPAIISPYANVRDTVIKKLKDQQQTRLRDAYIRELAKGAKIELVEPKIKALFPNVVFP